MAKSFDVICVGAGPAGSLAALKLARAGKSVCLLERGRRPGEKNMFGGLLHYTPVLSELIPDFTERAPLERHVYQKTLVFLTEDSAVSLSFASGNFDRPPFNGFTCFRPAFDAWLAAEAERAGALLLNNCTAENLIIKDGQTTGVTVKGREGELHANIVIAADGVLSLLAKQAGLRDDLRPAATGLGIKLLLGLPETTINERFGLARDQGADITLVGATGGLSGGAFIYTNRESLSVGLVVHLDALTASGRKPYEVLDEFLDHPAVRRLVRGAVPLEYSAHLIPEGGYKAVPRLYSGGLMLAGDAAGLCYTNGINLEGINLAMTSGVLAAATAIEALNAGDFSARFLSLYKKKLEKSFVIKDMKTFRHAAGMMHRENIFGKYPRVLASIMEKMYRVDGQPRKKLLRLVRREALKQVGLKGVVTDGIRIGRSLL
jgi:electron transfer flavoprotein-quinone oxidoreductase